MHTSSSHLVAVVYAKHVGLQVPGVKHAPPSEGLRPAEADA